MAMFKIVDGFLEMAWPNKWCVHFMQKQLSVMICSDMNIHLSSFHAFLLTINVWALLMCLFVTFFSHKLPPCIFCDSYFHCVCWRHVVKRRGAGNKNAKQVQLRSVDSFDWGVSGSVGLVGVHSFRRLHVALKKMRSAGDCCIFVIWVAPLVQKESPMLVQKCKHYSSFCSLAFVVCMSVRVSWFVCDLGRSEAQPLPEAVLLQILVVGLFLLRFRLDCFWLFWSSRVEFVGEISEISVLETSLKR